MLFAFTGMAVAASASTFWTVAAVAADIAVIAGTTMSAVSQYQQGKEQARQAKFAAQEQVKQAELNQQRANIEQLKGEEDARQRSLALSQEIGSAYATFAGNGLLVDRGAGQHGLDTVGNVLSSASGIAGQDIGTIRDNTAVNIWTLQENAGQGYRSANSLMKQSKAAYKGGIMSATGTGLSGAGGLFGQGLTGAAMAGKLS